MGAALGLFVIGYHWGNQYRRHNAGVPVIDGVLMVPALPLPVFELEDAAGHLFTDKSVRGRWTLFAVGDFDPRSRQGAIRRMIEVRNRLAGDPDLQTLLQLVLAVPDGAQSRTDDVGPLSPAVQFLAGDAAAFAHLRSLLGAPPATEDAATALPFYLIGPKGRLLALFPGTQTPAAIASDLSVIAGSFAALYPETD